MAVLEHLEPKNVFHFFEKLAAIPHGSTNTKAISDWCVKFAEERGLEHYQDDKNNVIIIKEATPGYENAAPVIVQGHLDMVCEKAPDCMKDMATEGLDLAVEGDTVYAKGTTLGGDDGIAVAMALAVLDASDIPHPRFEAVFTTDEEIGMLGAVDIDVSPLKARRMLNIDSEVEGVFTVSCAGGNMTRCDLPVYREAFAGSALTVRVSGLIGGHSGVEIDKGRANSSMLLGRILCALAGKTAFRLVSVNGGLKDNAIPRETTAVLVAQDADAVRDVCSTLGAAFTSEFRTTDPDVIVTVEAADAASLPMDKDSTDRIVCLLACAPNGIQVMSADMPGLVQTSLNLGVLVTEEKRVLASFCVRSSVETQKRMLVERLQALTARLGGTTAIFGDYPGWEYQTESPLRELMVEVYREQYGRDPKVEAIHAGVECGMFADKIPGLDCVSFGPDLTEIHTYREKMHIASVQRTYAMLLEVLRRMK